MHADLRFAHELADAADALTLSRFRALDLRVDTKPDLTPVSDADRAAEEAIRALVAALRAGRDRLRRGVRRRRRRREVDRRPDRRDEVVRARGADLGDPAGARTRRCSHARARLGAGAVEALVGGPRRGRVRRGAAESRVHGRAPRGRGRLDDVAARHAARVADGRRAVVVESRLRRLLAVLPRRRGRDRHRLRPRGADVGPRGRAARGGGGGRAVHDVRRR